MLQENNEIRNLIKTTTNLSDADERTENLGTILRNFMNATNMTLDAGTTQQEIGRLAGIHSTGKKSGIDSLS